MRLWRSGCDSDRFDPETFMIEEKKTRHHLKSEPKGPSERDMQIYELHKAGKTARRIGRKVRIVRIGDYPAANHLSLLPTKPMHHE